MDILLRQQQNIVTRYMSPTIIVVVDSTIVIGFNNRFIGSRVAAADNLIALAGCEVVSACNLLCRACATFIKHNLVHNAFTAARMTLMVSRTEQANISLCMYICKRLTITLYAW